MQIINQQYKHKYFKNNNLKMKNLKTKIINNLSDDLLKKEYLTLKNKNKYTGHCYVASEAYFHLSDEKLQPYYLKHENSSHWFLKNKKNEVIDLTAKQFITDIPYSNARKAVFLTKQPSKRCQILIKRVLKDLNIEKETTSFNKSFGIVEKIEIPLYYHYNENGQMIYDIEEITTYFNNEISKLK